MLLFVFFIVVIGLFSCIGLISDSKRPLRSFFPVFSSSRTRRSVVHARGEENCDMVGNDYSRHRRHELMKYRRSPNRRVRMERISLFTSSKNRRNTLQTRTRSHLLYSKETYVPYPSPSRRNETATNLLKKSSGISGVVIKRSYQIRSQSRDNGSKIRKISFSSPAQKTKCNKADIDQKKFSMLLRNNNIEMLKANKGVVRGTAKYFNARTQFSEGKNEHEEIPKRKLRWIGELQPGEVKTKRFLEYEDRSDLKIFPGN